jgi:hypothetical protein
MSAAYRAAAGAASWRDKILAGDARLADEAPVFEHFQIAALVELGKLFRDEIIAGTEVDADMHDVEISILLDRIDEGIPDLDIAHSGSSARAAASWRTGVEALPDAVRKSSAAPAPCLRFIRASWIAGRPCWPWPAVLAARSRGCA